MADSLLDFSLAFNSSDIVRTGQYLVSNATNPRSVGVATLADAGNTAILVPTDFVREWNSSASIYGACAQCFVISSYCVENANQCAASGSFGPAIDAGSDNPVTGLGARCQLPQLLRCGAADGSGRERYCGFEHGVTGVGRGRPPVDSWSGPDKEANPLIHADIVAGDSGDEYQTRCISKLDAQCKLEFVQVKYSYNDISQLIAYHIGEKTGLDTQLAGVF
ncbi:hypothetical protein BDV93DRAFT_563464 [Ceratobasidium sp. AG-I]|nr:hypothetical protein BDV93DRAFT_563464 [Ceratobasidium sp. AG-I]